MPTDGTGGISLVGGERFAIDVLSRLSRETREKRGAENTKRNSEAALSILPCLIRFRRFRRGADAHRLCARHTCASQARRARAREYLSPVPPPPPPPRRLHGRYVVTMKGVAFEDQKHLALSRSRRTLYPTIGCCQVSGMASDLAGVHPFPPVLSRRGTIPDVPRRLLVPSNLGLSSGHARTSISSSARIRANRAREATHAQGNASLSRARSRLPGLKEDAIRRNGISSSSLSLSLWE